MKINHYIYLAWTVICMIAVSLAACSDHDYPDGDNSGSDSGGTFSIGFDIMLPYLPGDSRASYEQGVGDYENTIDLRNRDFRILLFNTDETPILVCSFTPEQVVMIEKQPQISHPDYRTYRLMAEVDKDIASYTALKLVVLANWGNYPAFTVGTTTIDDLAGLASGIVSKDTSTTFEASATMIAQGGKHIPMFGVRDCTDITWTNFNLSWLGELWLLRSVAKIEVRTGDGSPKVSEVVLTRYNKIGTCAPMRVYSHSDYVGDNEADNVSSKPQYKTINYLTLPGGANEPAESTYKIQPDADGVFVVYVPEYQNITAPTEPTNLASDYARLQVKFEGTDKTYDVDFKYYNQSAASENSASAGDYFDLKRNYYYRYTLRQTQAEPEVVVDVLPYRAITLKPDFGLPLKGITLSKNVVYLYTNSDENTNPTNSSDEITVIGENGLQINASNVDWSFADQIYEETESDDDAQFRQEHPDAIRGNVCWIYENEQGNCVLHSRAHKRGRDVVTASVRDNNGVSYEAELVVEVSGRHLGLDKTFIGLLPDDESDESLQTSFNGTIIAETDENCTLSWRLLKTSAQSFDAADDQESELEYLRSNIEILVDGVSIENGAKIGDVKNFVVQVRGGRLEGTAHLWIQVDCPDRYENSTARVQYSTYCEIMVQEPTITLYPQQAYVTVGQTTSFASIIYPKFSDYFPEVKYRVLPFDDPEKEAEDPAASYVSIDSNGLVEGLKPGTITIQAYNDTDFPNVISDEVELIINPDNLVLIRGDYPEENIVADQIELLNGDSVKINATSNGKDISDKVTWELEENAFVSLTTTGANAGLVTGNLANDTNAGTTTVKVTYKSGNTTRTQKCIVVVARTRKLIVNQFPSAVMQNSEVPLSAYIFPDKRPYEKRELDVNWSSSTPGIMAFDSQNGKNVAVAKAHGLAKLLAEATYEGQSYKNDFEIEVLKTGIETEATFNVNIYDSDNTLIGSMNSIDGEYTHEDITGGKMSSFITQPYTQYKAEVVVASRDAVIEKVEWEWYLRHSFHERRMNISPIDGSIVENNIKVTGNTINITSCTDDKTSTRYNEIIVKITYDGGKIGSYRFAVFQHD